MDDTQQIDIICPRSNADGKDRHPTYQLGPANTEANAMTRLFEKLPAVRYRPAHARRRKLS